MILATCGTIVAILAAAQGGETIRLEGHCPRITLTKRVFEPRINIDATNAVVEGLQLNQSGGINWRGGIITAPSGGTFTTGPAGYGVSGTGAKNLLLEGVTIREALKGLVWIKDSSGLSVSHSVFEKIGGDAINIASSRRVVIFMNKIRDFYDNPGYHQDGIQMWNGASDIVIQGNEVAGEMQGITDFGATGQPPVTRVRVIGNQVRVSHYHGITLGTATNSLISGNNVTGTHAQRATIVRFSEDTEACGNIVWDRPQSLPAQPC